jgi:hypothetical protein
MSTSEYTPLEEIESVRSSIVLHIAAVSKSEQIHDALNASFRAGKTRNIALRKQQLAKLAYMIKVSNKTEDDGCLLIAFRITLA